MKSPRVDFPIESCLREVALTLFVLTKSAQDRSLSFSSLTMAPTLKVPSSKTTWHRSAFALMCLVLVSFLASSTHGHGRGHALMFPRRAYNYHRRSPAMDLMSDMFSMPMYFNSLFQQDQEQAARHVSPDPSYHVQELPSGEIELTMDVPGVAAADLNVELIEDGTLLRVRGSRRRHGSTAEFEKLFRLDKEVDADNISVRLADGVLRVTAPKKEKLVKKLQIVVEDEKDVLQVEGRVVSETEDSNIDGDSETHEVDGMTITSENEQ